MPPPPYSAHQRYGSALASPPVAPAARMRANDAIAYRFKNPRLVVDHPPRRAHHVGVRGGDDRPAGIELVRRAGAAEPMDRRAALVEREEVAVASAAAAAVFRAPLIRIGLGRLRRRADEGGE